MEIQLSDTELRILGCLIEKEITTPDYYPLTLNALTNACNQKSNRNPVVSFEETTVVRGLDGLREKGLAAMIYTVGSRVPKYKHTADEKFDFTKGEIAVLSELMLRGPQTVGELRTHAGRIYEFRGLDEVEEIVQGLMEGERPLIMKLPRQVGQKEQRYTHLFAGEPDQPESEQTLPAEPATLRVRTENERIARLEEDVTAMRREIEELKRAFQEFKGQF